MPGTGELLLIALVAIIVVDPKKLPDLMKSLGKAIGEFKQMSGEFKRTIERETEMADFEKRKAEAHEQLYGTGATTETPAAAPEASAEAKTTPSLADDAWFSSELTIALYLLPVVFGGIGVNLISHVLLHHLTAAEELFEREHPDA